MNEKVDESTQTCIKSEDLNSIFRFIKYNSSLFKCFKAQLNKKNTFKYDSLILRSVQDELANIFTQNDPIIKKSNVNNNNNTILKQNDYAKEPLQIVKKIENEKRVDSLNSKDDLFIYELKNVLEKRNKKLLTDYLP